MHTPEGGFTAWTVKETLFLWGAAGLFKLWFWRNKTWWFEEWSEGVPKMNDDGNLVDEMIAMAMLDNCTYFFFFFFTVGFIYFSGFFFHLFLCGFEGGVDTEDTCNNNHVRWLDMIKQQIHFWFFFFFFLHLFHFPNNLFSKKKKSTYVGSLACDIRVYSFIWSYVRLSPI